MYDCWKRIDGFIKVFFLLVFCFFGQLFDVDKPLSRDLRADCNHLSNPICSFNLKQNVQLSSVFSCLKLYNYYTTEWLNSNLICFNTFFIGP